MMASEEARCPNCGALVAEGAEWCGQCYASLKPAPEPEPEREPVPAQQAGGAAAEAANPAAAPAQASGTKEKVAGDKPVPVWACPVCEHENSLDRDICEVCGTSFGKLLDEPAKTVEVEPSAAARAAIIPGMGHVKVGLGAEGLVRLLVFLGAIGFAMLFFSGKGISALLLTAIFLVAALLLYIEGFVDAYRLAQGRDQIVSGRLILYVFAGLFGLAVVVVMAFALKAPGAVK